MFINDKTIYHEDDYEDRHDYLKEMFIHQLSSRLPFSYWDSGSVMRLHRPYADEFMVTITGDDMRESLHETYMNILEFDVKDYVADKYGFFSFTSDNHAGRQMTGVFVQFMVDFRLEHRFLGSVIKTGNACSAAIEKAFGRDAASADGTGESIMEADLACAAISYMLHMVCIKLLNTIERTNKLPVMQELRPIQVYMEMYEVPLKSLSKKAQKMIRVIDKIVKKVLDDEEYIVGSFALDILACEVELTDINTPEANAVLWCLRQEKKTLLDDKQILSGLLMDPRLNNCESNFLTKEQKEVALNHLMMRQKNYNYLLEKISRANPATAVAATEKTTTTVDSVAERVNKMVVGHQPAGPKGVLRKKLRGLESQPPQPNTCDVLNYWRKKAPEDPELANLAGLAFAESAPWASNCGMAFYLERQNTTDEELEKLVFIGYNSMLDSN